MNSNHISTLIHIGAGIGNELKEYLELSIDRIILIEPLPELSEKLKEITQNEPKIEVWECAVTTQNAEKVSFIEHNLIETSSLHPALGLQKLFPGLRVTGNHSVRAVTPEEMIKAVNITGDDNNHLVVEANGEEKSILKSLVNADNLALFSKIKVNIPSENLYKTKDSEGDIVTYLTENCFEITNVENSDPDFPQYHFSLNKEKKKIKEIESELTEQRTKKEQLNLAFIQEKEINKKLSTENEKSKEEIKALTENIDSLKNTLQISSEKIRELEQQNNTSQQELAVTKENTASLQKQLLVEQEKYQNAKQKAEARESSLNTHIQSLEQEKKQLHEKVKLLQEQLAELKSSGEAINILKKQMEHLFLQQTLQLEQAANALGKHITRTANDTSNELKAYAQIQQTGIPAYSLEYAGRTLPPAHALQITRLLQQTSYDLVIQLSSGVETLFIAETLKSSGNQKKLKMLENGGNVTSYNNEEIFDLPKPIVTFEANRTELKRLEQKLKQHDLHSLVETQFAPLIDYQLSNVSGLFLDIKQQFQHIASLFQGRTAHILVLIKPDEGISASYSDLALPLLLQFFATHSLSLLLNTTNEAQKTELRQDWSTLLNNRGFEYKWSPNDENSPRALLQVNP